MGNMGQEGGRGVETDSEVLHKAATIANPWEHEWDCQA